MVDEVDKWVELHKIPQGFNALIQYGRHQEIALYLATRRPADISKKVTSQAQVAYIGAMHEPRDVEYLRKAYGEGAEGAPALDNFQFLKWEEGKGITARLGADRQPIEAPAPEPEPEPEPVPAGEEVSE